MTVSFPSQIQEIFDTKLSFSDIVASDFMLLFKKKLSIVGKKTTEQSLRDNSAFQLE